MMTPLDFLTSMTPGIKQPEGRFRWTENVFADLRRLQRKFSLAVSSPFLFVVEL